MNPTSAAYEAMDVLVNSLDTESFPEQILEVIQVLTLITIVSMAIGGTNPRPLTSKELDKAFKALELIHRNVRTALANYDTGNGIAE